MLSPPMDDAEITLKLKLDAVYRIDNSLWALSSNFELPTAMVIPEVDTENVTITSYHFGVKVTLKSLMGVRVTFKRKPLGWVGVGSATAWAIFDTKLRGVTPVTEASFRDVKVLRFAGDSGGKKTANFAVAIKHLKYGG